MMILKLIILILYYLSFGFAQELDKTQKIFEISQFGPTKLIWGVLPLVINELKLTKNCEYSLNFTINQLYDGYLWPNELIESSGSGFNNLFEGTYLNLGNYDQCLSINLNSIYRKNLTTTSDELNGVKNFTGKYCLFNLLPQESILSHIGLNDTLRKEEFYNLYLNTSQKLNVLFKFKHELNVKFGFCLPSSCTDLDAYNILNSVLDEYKWKIDLDVNCEIKQSFSKSLIQNERNALISLSALFIYLSIFIFISLVHIIVFQKETSILNYLLCFSIKKNLVKLFSNRFDKDGIFVLDILQSMVILFCTVSHSYFYFIWLDAFAVYEKIYDYIYYTKSLFSQPFINIYDINTGLMFIISSTIECFKLYKVEKLNFSICSKLIMKKILKFVILMAILICIQLNLHLFISGPLIKQNLKKYANFCTQSWYMNLLLINNFVPYESQCVLHSWIISTELQLFICLNLLILFYRKYPKATKFINISIILISLASIIYIVYSQFLTIQFIPMPLNLNRLKQRAKLIHFAPYVYIFEYFLPPFVINLIYSKKIIKAKVVIRKLFLCLFITTLIFMPICSYLFYSKEFVGYKSLNTFIVIIYKLILPVFFTWIIYNYYDVKFKNILNEFGLKSFYDKLIEIQLFQKSICEHKLNLKQKLYIQTETESKSNYLCVSSKPLSGEEENDKLIQMKMLDLKMVKNVCSCNCCFKIDFNLRCNHKKLFYSIKYCLLVYARLATSLYLSHHFYLLIDLYTIRSPLSIKPYNIFARIIYNLSYMHLFAIIFYIFIELPITSFLDLLIK